MNPVPASTPTVQAAAPWSRLLRSRAFWACSLAVAAFVVFFPSLGGEILLWDDDINLIVTPAVQQVDAASVKWMFTDTAQVLRYKPLSWLTWATLHHVFGVGDAPYHAVIVVLHAANTVLLFLLLDTLISRWTGVRSVRSLIVAVSATAWWAFHPMRIEPVAWISGMGYPLAMFFGLLSLQALTVGLSRNSARARRLAVGLSILLWTLALLSYPSAFCLLPAFPITAIVLSPARSKMGSLVVAIPHVVLGCGMVVFATVSRIVNPGAWSPTGLGAVPLSEEIARLGLFWFWSLIRQFPFATISPLHDSAMNPSLLSPAAIAAWLSVGVITFGALLLRRRSSAPLVLWIAFLAALVPHAGLTESEFLPSERYLYTASIFVVAAVGIVLASARISNRLIGVLSAAVLGLAAQTWAHADLWHSNVAFLSRARGLATSPFYQAKLAGRLGMALAAHGRAAESIELLELGLTSEPSNWLFRASLAEALAATEQAERSVGEYRKLLAQNPNPWIAKKLSASLIHLGRYDEAVAVLREAVIFDSAPDTLTRLASALAASGQTADALAILTVELQTQWAPAAALAKDLRAPQEALR